jgi:hypothetical protein
MPRPISRPIFDEHDVDVMSQEEDTEEDEGPAPPGTNLPGRPIFDESGDQP